MRVVFKRPVEFNLDDGSKIKYEPDVEHVIDDDLAGKIEHNFLFKHLERKGEVVRIRETAPAAADKQPKKTGKNDKKVSEPEADKGKDADTADTDKNESETSNAEPEADKSDKKAKPKKTKE